MHFQTFQDDFQKQRGDLEDSPSTYIFDKKVRRNGKSELRERSQKKEGLTKEESKKNPRRKIPTEMETKTEIGDERLRAK
jgi:hypothetical protein